MLVFSLLHAVALIGDRPAESSLHNVIIAMKRTGSQREKQ